MRDDPDKSGSVGIADAHQEVSTTDLEQSEEQQEFKRRIIAAKRAIGLSVTAESRSAQKRSVDVCDTGAANPLHSIRVEENRKYNATVNNQAIGAMRGLNRLGKELDSLPDADAVWRWLEGELRLTLLAPKEAYQQCFMPSGGIDWIQVNRLAREIPYNRHCPNLADQMIDSLHSIYSCFWV